MQFVVRGKPAQSLARRLNEGAVTAAAIERSLQDVATSLGGSLAAFYFVGGTWDLFSLFDMPVEGALSLLLGLQTGDVFAAGEVRLALTLEARQIDDMFAIRRQHGFPWGVAGHEMEG